ncbi:MOSC domain-containing protein [Sporosarcina sp. G11-34]|uniref:MOSC domain-containing protein n=1 Tax=Sporosarcina sp. G11-34 TaxID=2849605 RepID=UPI0022A90B35|nr:MOSC domain-containing protein [Sporosarcina sp. G11-34]MCZ2258962.1 MOSC domain-containing protein [Sporosarcina sp. G11-34]
MDISLGKVLVGLPKIIGQKDAVHPMDREWESAIFKELIEEAVWVGTTKLDGDGQADLKNHGGPEKAVFAYPSEHYTFWCEEYGITDMKQGGVGENFSMINVTEKDIAIGDTFEVGGAIVQVSQPRQPCWKPARRFKIKNLALLIEDTGRTGWYFRVLQEGFVEEGQKFKLIDRPVPEWTIEKCNRVMHIEKEDLEKSANLAKCEWLATNWKRTLTNRVEKGEHPQLSKRVFGPNE